MGGLLWMIDLARFIDLDTVVDLSDIQFVTVVYVLLHQLLQPRLQARTG
jgi:hypothetical protein